jgi:DNA-binding MarR family transcriptional regulator
MDNSNHCGLSIKQIHDALEKHANNNLRDKDLTMAQLQLLFQLAESENGELQLKDLERILKVAQSSAAGIVVRLEQKGFIEGHVSSDDKRVKFARITDSGRAICQSSYADMERAEQQLFGGLTSEENAMFLLLLKKICTSLT